MNRVRLLLPALLACLVLGMVPGCTEQPEAPVWNNPLDPRSPQGGDPFAVQAAFSAGKVIVTWNRLTNAAVTGYEVLHSLTAGGPYAVIATLEDGVGTYLDPDFAPNLPNYYKVRALNAAAEASAVANVSAAAVVAPPLVTRGGLTALRRRVLDLHVRADAGEEVQVDSLPGFPAPAAATLADGEADLAWDTGDAFLTGEWKHYYVRVLTGGASGMVYRDSIRVDFTPDLVFEGTPATLARRDAPLTILDGEGVAQMRFAADRAALAAAAWLPGATRHAGYQLDVAPDSQLVFGEFQGDMGLTWVDSVWAVPDPLEGLELVVNSGSATVAADAFPVYVDAAATQMRLAATAEDLAAAPWQPYAMPAQWTHDGCGSDVVKRVWVQVRNDWTAAEGLTGTVVWLPPEALGLSFAGPDTVSAQSLAVLTGTAVPGTCTAAVDGVFLDPGTGEAPATGLADWTFPWTAPAVDDTTTVDVAWRVTAGADTATGAFRVVVIP